MKKCYVCEERKEDHLFYRDGRSHDGLSSACVECRKKLSRENYEKKKTLFTDAQGEARRAAYQKWKAANPERYKELMKKHNGATNLSS